MNPLTTLRDWWFRPVTDRLDRIEAAVRPQFYGKLTSGKLTAEQAELVALRRGRVTPYKLY